LTDFSSRPLRGNITYQGRCPSAGYGQGTLRGSIANNFPLRKERLHGDGVSKFERTQDEPHRSQDRYCHDHTTTVRYIGRCCAEGDIVADKRSARRQSAKDGGPVKNRGSESRFGK
jgi:hypothetical protein